VYHWGDVVQNEFESCRPVARARTGVQRHWFATRLRLQTVRVSTLKMAGPDTRFQVRTRHPGRSPALLRIAHIGESGGVMSDNPKVVEPAMEKHFSPQEVAKMWGLCEDTIRDLFRGEPDVLHITRPKTRGKRTYTTLRIPLSVLLRVHRRMRVV